jgi:hypothetical protein
MTIELQNQQLSLIGITGDSHTLADDIRPFSDEKAGTATEPSRSTSPHDIIAKISENGKMHDEPPKTFYNRQPCH